MTTEDIYQLTREQLTEHANQALDCMFAYLANQSILTQKQYEQMTQFRVIVSKKSLWQSIGNKLWGRTDKDTLKFIIVEVKDAYMPNRPEQEAACTF